MSAVAFQRINANQEDNCLLAAYIEEWKKFFQQCSYFPLVFRGPSARITRGREAEAEQGDSSEILDPIIWR